MFRAALGRLGGLLPRAAVAASPAPLLTLTRGLKFKSRMGRGKAHRWAMMKNMATSLIQHERIKTGLAKGKELRRFTDRLITYAKKGDLASYRRAARLTMTKDSLTKLFTILADRYEGRSGGYTRVLKTYPRFGDQAEVAFVELVDRPMKYMPYALPEQNTSVVPGRGGRKWRARGRDLGDEIYPRGPR